MVTPSRLPWQPACIPAASCGTLRCLFFLPELLVIEVALRRLLFLPLPSLPDCVSRLFAACGLLSCFVSLGLNCRPWGEIKNPHSRHLTFFFPTGPLAVCALECHPPESSLGGGCCASPDLGRTPDPATHPRPLSSYRRSLAPLPFSLPLLS